MKKKLIISLSAVAVLALVVLGINQLMPKKVEGAKSITIVIRDDMTGTELFSDVLHTDTETMYEFLVEKTQLKAVMDESQFGNFITSMMDVEQGDMSTGPWWLYESKNNESCLSAGMCPGVDALNLQDGDDFLFKLTNSFE